MLKIWIHCIFIEKLSVLILNILKMKNLATLSLILMFFAIPNVNAQFDFGVKMGFHSFELSNPSDIVLPDDESISFTDAKLGFQGGFYTRFGIGNIYLEPRLMLHSTSVEYTFNGDNGGLIDNIKKESFTNLDIPVLLGFDVLFVNAFVGPVAHLNLNSSSDLFDIAGYEDRFKTATYGFRAGVCMSLGSIELSLEYEGNFSEFGEHINIGGQEFSFDERPSRLIFNLGIPIF